MHLEDVCMVLQRRLEHLDGFDPSHPPTASVIFDESADAANVWVYVCCQPRDLAS